MALLGEHSQELSCIDRRWWWNHCSSDFWALGLADEWADFWSDQRSIRRAFSGRRNCFRRCSYPSSKLSRSSWWSWSRWCSTHTWQFGSICYYILIVYSAKSWTGSTQQRTATLCPRCSSWMIHVDQLAALTIFADLGSKYLDGLLKEDQHENLGLIDLTEW